MTEQGELPPRTPRFPRLEGRFGIVSHPDILRLVSDNFRSQGRYYAISIIAMIIVAAMTSATAWVMQAIIDSMTVSEHHNRVFWVAGAVAAIFTIKGLASYVQIVSLTRAGNRIVSQQQVKLFDRLLKQGVAFFNETESSDLLMRITQSAQAARATVDTVVTSYVRDALSLVGLVAVMFYQQPLLSLVSLVFGPLAILAVRSILSRVRELASKEMTSMAEIIRVIQETSSGIRVIKVFELEKQMADRMFSAVRQVEKRSNAMARIQATTIPLMDSLSGFAIASVVALSAVNLLGGAPTSPGQLMSFVTALLMAYEPAKRLSRVRVILEQNLVAIRMMYAIMDQPLFMTEHAEAKDLDPGPGHIRFQNVQFGYKGETSVIKDLTLDFPAGKMTALVGPSGGGKSTILNLVMRMYDPRSGKVLIDGQDISRATFSSLRRRTSFVGQETFLFSTTIMENIRAGRPGATDDEVIEAAKAAQAHDFIAKFPNGYATEVGENGSFLSGGQRQRIAIARAILRQADILLLDEATSALDSDSESAVKDSIRALSDGVTTIVIAHRLSTILNADKICVIRAGEVIEEGPVRELLAKEGGEFRNLFDKQFGEAGLLSDI